MIKANITQEESQLHNLTEWCYEVGSPFEELGRLAARDFIKYITANHVLELGCGDGASLREFWANNIRAIGVDINAEKLEGLGSLAWQSDMLSALKVLKDNSVHNIFAHHSLEHVVNAQEVIKEISRVLRPMGFFYAIVPAYDYLHSVHHVVFESSDELLPEGCKAIRMEPQARALTVDGVTRLEKEFICVAQKLA